MIVFTLVIVALSLCLLTVGLWVVLLCCLAALAGNTHRGLAEALVETDQPAENLLAVGMQLLQLVLYQSCVLRRAPLDQTLSKHDQAVDALGVQRDLFLETLQDQGWNIRGREHYC